MYNEISESGFQGILTQYWQPEKPVHPEEATAFKFISKKLVVGHPYIDGGPEPSGVNQTKMVEEVEHAIKAANELGYGWPTLEEAKKNVNDQFVLFTTPAATFSPPSEFEYCGAHFHTSGGYVYDIVKDCGVGSTAATGTSSHEYAEAVTDPYYEGWREWPLTSKPNEIADICGGEFGFLPNEIQVVGLYDNYKSGCSTSDASPAQLKPEILTGEASGVTKSEGTLHGKFTSNGLAAEFYWIEWGTSLSYGNTTNKKLVENLRFEYGEEAHETITGLSAGTTYHYRMVVEDAGFNPGVQTGKDQTFKTPGSPIVTTEPATYTNTFEPQLNASVNPNGADTHYQFEYGLTESYGTKIPITAEDIGSGTEALTVSQTLEGLERNKTYHYRVTATNEVNTTHGTDKSFTTLPPCKKVEGKCEWSVQSTLNGSPKTEDKMSGVSCPSSSRCLAVGRERRRRRELPGALERQRMEIHQLGDRRRSEEDLLLLDHLLHRRGRK